MTTLEVVGAVAIGLVALVEGYQLYFGPGEPEPEEPPDWSAEDPAVIAAARAMCSEWPGRPPCAGCMADTKRVLRAFEAARAGQ